MILILFLETFGEPANKSAQHNLSTLALLIFNTFFRVYSLILGVLFNTFDKAQRDPKGGWMIHQRKGWGVDGLDHTCTAALHWIFFFFYHFF